MGFWSVFLKFKMDILYWTFFLFERYEQLLLTVFFYIYKAHILTVRNHGVKFGENRITFDPSPHIKSPLEIHVYAHKWPKNIGIIMKFGINRIFNLYHITKFCYGQSIIDPRSKIGLLKKLYLAIIIGLKILSPRWNSTWTYSIWMWVILSGFIMIGS